MSFIYRFTDQSHIACCISRQEAERAQGQRNDLSSLIGPPTMWHTTLLSTLPALVAQLGCPHNGPWPWDLDRVKTLHWLRGTGGLVAVSLLGAVARSGVRTPLDSPRLPAQHGLRCGPTTPCTARLASQPWSDRGAASWRHQHDLSPPHCCAMSAGALPPSPLPPCRCRGWLLCCHHHGPLSHWGPEGDKCPSSNGWQFLHGLQCVTDSAHSPPI